MEIGNRVIIKGTNTVFDGKEGVLEEIMQDDDNTKCTVFVDFIPEEGKKVRQNFEINNIEQLNESVKIREDKGETTVEKDIKIEKLAKYLGINANDIKKSEYDENVYEIDNGEQEWLVCNEEQAYDRAVDDIKSFYDDQGIGGFTPDFQEWILENAVNTDFLEDATREDIIALVDELDDEEVADECIEEGIVESYEVYDENSDEWSPELKDDVDFYDLRQQLIDKKFDDVEDYKEYWISMLGESEFYQWLQDSEYADVDLDKVADECIKWDGKAHFISSYDGEEVDLGDDLYAYRLN